MNCKIYKSPDESLKIKTKSPQEGIGIVTQYQIYESEVNKT